MIVAGSACGPKPPPARTLANAAPEPVGVEWRAKQADGENVAVTLVVDRRPVELGTLYAASDSATGTPATCAIARADARGTAFTCGDVPEYNFFAAELDGGDLVVRRVTGTYGNSASEKRVEIQRIPVGEGVGLAVAPYQLATGR